MASNILITGGAGFVGSHLADELLAHGYNVRVLDSLTRQVHPQGRRPEYLNEAVELVVGDIRDAEAVGRALEGMDAVFHLAAAVGVGQSMYEVAHYTDVNCNGTAVLLEAMIRRKVGRMVVASSMSIYGEGLYRTAAGDLVEGRERTLQQLAAHEWELRDEAGNLLEPAPTPERKTPALPSVYAISKYHQECMALTVGRAYGIATAALRFFSIYGPRQALSNPYTGVLANFASRLLNGRPPLIMEDGQQRRDFVNVRDAVRACRLALESPQASGKAFNIGSGTSRAIVDVARTIGRVLGRKIEPEMTHDYRKGDIRHCFADISAAKSVLGYAPQVSLDDGLCELAEWLKGQSATDCTERAREELQARGLTI